VKAVTGMGDACRKFNTPVTGGNVSFYNQNPDGPVYPTPTIGMVGLLDDANQKMTMYFKNEGDVIVMIGKAVNDIGSSEYLHKLKSTEYSPAPYFDLEEEYYMQQVLAGTIKEKLVNSAHDISEGGLMVTLLESGFQKGLGFTITFQSNNIRQDAFWLGETQGRVVVSVSKEKLGVLKDRLRTEGQYFLELGTVTTSINVNGADWGNIEDWKEKYDTAIEKYLQ
jgi:phosphoribosylformylglycinamidine synthase